MNSIDLKCIAGKYNKTIKHRIISEFSMIRLRENLSATTPAKGVNMINGIKCMIKTYAMIEFLELSCINTVVIATKLNQSPKWLIKFAFNKCR